MHSPDFTAQNIAKLAELFPNCVTESKDDKGNLRNSIDFDLLKQELSANVVEDPQERYRLDWPGKRDALITANTPVTKTLRPHRGESVDFDTTENLFIEGDNLDALKLLQETYLSKVKLIYIDPPYNTGNDFIYKDKFAESTEEYHLESGQKDEEGNRLVANTDSNGRFHSDWLSMMYPRLKLARNLLKDDGVIFISIDDHEVSNLKRMCDEIFGEENFVNIISAKMKNIAGASGGGEDKRLRKNIEFILVYVKDYSLFESFIKVYNFTPMEKLLDFYRRENISWKYTSVLTNPGEKKYLKSTLDGDGNEIKIYKRVNPEFSSISKIKSQEGLSEACAYLNYRESIFTTAMPQSSIRDRVVSAVENEEKYELYSIEYTPKTGKNKGRLYEQFYKGEQLRLLSWFKDVSEVRGDVVYKKDLVGTLWDKIDLNNLTREGDVKFDNGKKPLGLIQKLVSMVSDVANNDIILDFFAGSATTAHAVMQLNAEDFSTDSAQVGKRRFIMVQLREKCDEKIETGYENIAEISKERIRRAGKKIKEENVEVAANLDIGFRVLKVDSSNMADVYYTPDTTEQTQLSNLTENIKPDRTPDDLLFQVLLNWGVDLTLPITTETVKGLEVFFVDKDALVACFAPDGQITEDLCKELATRKPLRVVFRDSGFENDSVKVNVEQIFKLLSPGTDVKTV